MAIISNVNVPKIDIPSQKNNKGSSVSKIQSDSIQKEKMININIQNINKESMVLTSNTFNDANDNNRAYGGNQASLIISVEDFIDDNNVWEIVHKYYPEASKEDIELLFNRMNFVGCGYVAAVNTLFQYFDSIPNGQSKFEEIFGFSMLTNKENPSTGEHYYGYRYEYLFLDFFLYYAKNERGFDTIEEAYGNVEEEMEIRNNDAALDEEEFERTGMEGTYAVEAGNVFAKYLEEKGIELSVTSDTITTKITLEPGTEEWKKRKEELEAIGINIPDDQPITENETEKVDIKEALREGKFAIVSANDFTLYYPEDIDGNGKLDDIYIEDVGSHAMTIVDITDDGKYIVSSWGHKYILNPNLDKPTGIAIYDYER